MSKHTPGKWKASCRHVSYPGGEWPEDEFLQWEVEGPRTPWGRGEFYQKDAQLIAAAPDLLEALKELHNRLIKCSADPISTAEAYDSFYQEMVCAAIDKAEGKA